MIHQRIVSRIRATEQNSLEDKAVVPDGHCMHLEYVDNWVVLGTDKGKVSSLAGAGVEALRNSGLVVHEVEHASKQIKVLGWEFDNNIFRPRPMRVWRVRKAFEYLLQRGSCTGRQLEKIVGHANFLCLGRRESLSVFGETYTFIQRNYWNKARIWRSVRRELNIFIGVCPLIWRDLAAPWETEVTAVDATTAVFEVGQVAELVRYSEHWRFDYPHLARPREHAFGVAIADDPQKAAAAAWASNEARGPEGLRPIRVVQPKSHEQIFKTVPFSVVDRDWKVCGRHRWARPEPIPVLEARASLFAVRHALRSGRTFGKRVLILSGSISAVCALDRGRGQSFKMRRVSQQVAALSLGGNVQLAFRWVPSEWNPADGPSRGSIFPSKPSLMPHGIEHDPPIPSGGKTVPQEGKQEEAPRVLPIGSSEQCDRGEEETTGEEEGTVAIGWMSGRSVCLREEPGDLDCWDKMISYTSVRLDERSPPSLVDSCLEEMLNHMFEQGEDLSKSQYMLAAVLYRLPHLKSSKQAMLPRSKQSLQGWRRLDPPKSRLPLPWEVVCLMIKYAMAHNYLQEALIMAMCFALYLRPGEVSRLRCRDLVPPVRNAKKTARTWSVVLHPVELEVVSKTAEFDETVTFDDLETQYIPEAVSKHMKSRTRGKNQMLFTSNSIQLKAVMEEAAKAEHLGPPHPFRKRRLDEIQRRGRWKSFASVRRYEKGGRLNQMLHELDPKVLDKCLQAADNIEHILQSKH